MLLTVPLAFYLSLTVSAARRILRKAAPSRETPGESQFNLWLYHTDGQSAFVATCETRSAARALDHALQPVLNNTPFYTKLQPNKFVDPSERFTNGADAFLLEQDDFSDDTPGFSMEFMDRFNRRLSSFTSPSSAT